MGGPQSPLWRSPSHPCLARVPVPLSGHSGPWPSWAFHPPPSLSGIYKGFCLDVIRNKYECELQGARQHLEVTDGRLGEEGGSGPPCPSWLSCCHLSQSEKLLLYDTLQGELQERIQRLEEDRQSLDISSGEARRRPQHPCPRPGPVSAQPLPGPSHLCLDKGIARRVAVETE